MSVSEIRQRGLTWRSMLALLFSTGVVQLAIVYYELIAGSLLPLQSWFVILLWSEISRFLGSPLSKQELFILLSFQYAIAGGYALRFLEPIQYMYYATTPEVSEMGILKHIPSWWIPPPSVAYGLYTSRWVYINPAWVMPIAIMILSTALGMIANISMGYFAYSLYVRTEKLEFPAASAQAGTILTLSERNPLQVRALMVTALVGAVYNFVVSFLPFALGPFLTSGGISTSTVISPIAADHDLSPLIASALPGAGFSFTLNMINYLPGLLLPPRICIAQLAGALAFYFIGTYVITNMNLWPEESPYSQSWTLDLLTERANLYFYTSILIGLSLAVTFVPLLMRSRALFGKGFSGLKGRVSSQEASPMLLLALFIGACIGSVLLVYSLTGFPLWILLLFTLGGSSFASFIGVSAAGVTYSGFNIPYLKEFMIYTSQWPGREIWFAPVTMYTGGTNIAIAFKQADLLDADKGEYVKAYVFVVALGLVFSFLQVSYLWQISPMPSGAYPATITSWPVSALNWARFQKWIWSGYIFKETLIVQSFAVGAVAYVVLYVLKMPFLLISFIAGTRLGINITLAQLIGSAIGRRVLMPMMDRKTPGTYRTLAGRMVIGATIGWGFIEFMRALLILVGRSMWLLPY